MTVKGENQESVAVEEKPKPVYHHGWIISPQFIYGDGRMDIEYYDLENPEVGGKVFRGSIEKAKEEINQYVNENQD